MVLPRDTHADIYHIAVIAEQGITAVLGDDTDGDNNGKPPAITPGLKEV